MSRIPTCTMSTEQLKTEHLETMPSVKAPGILYVSQRFQLAIHLCACGCGGEAVTPLRSESEAIPGWTYKEEDQGPTLHPSIGHQQWDCGSHYFVQNGKIILCGDHGATKKTKPTMRSA